MKSLPVIYDGRLQPLVDLVFLPGLPQILPRYDNRAQESNVWLRDVFSHQFPRARVMSFNYDFAQEKHTSGWPEIIDKAVDLLYALEYRRDQIDEEQKPVIFLCRSFGGLILKKALLIARYSTSPRWRNLLGKVGGILFMGCLHDERGQDFTDCCMRCAAVELNLLDKKNAIIGALQDPKGLADVRDIQKDFRESNMSFPVRSFYETKQTLYRTGRFRHDHDILVPGSMSNLDFDNQDSRSEEMNHNEMCSFPNRAHPFFEHLLLEVRALIDRSQSMAEIQHPYPAGAASVAEIMNLRKVPSITSLEVLSGKSFSILDGFDRADYVAELEISLPHTPASVVDDPVSLNLPCYMVNPYQENRYFIGRDEILQDLRTKLLQDNKHANRQATYALCGLGGVGKTQIALQVAHEAQLSGSFKAILWTRADTRSKLAESFFAFSVALGLVGKDSTHASNAKEKAKNWFETTEERWLIIFDNLDSEDNKELLSEFKPNEQNASGSVLITSRDRRLISQYGGRQVPDLDESSAAELLLSLTKQDEIEKSYQFTEERRAAGEVARQLGCYPLALITAANVIVNSQCLLSEFLEAFSLREMVEESEAVQFATNTEGRYSHSLSTVWDMNFRHLEGNERGLLNLLAFLDADGIPSRLLFEGCTKTQKPELAFLGSRLKLIQCRRKMLQSSLVEQNAESGELGMHRMVRLICHIKMSPQERQESFTRAVYIVHSAWPVAERHFRHRPELWEDQRAYLPHVQSLCDYYVSSRETDSRYKPLEADLDFADMLYQASWFLYETGLFESIYPLLEVAQSVCHILPDSAAILADIHGCRASLDTETNDAHHAFSSFEQQFRYNQEALSSGLLQRPNVREALSYGGLANGFQGLRRYAEAEAKYRKCIEVWQTCPGTPAIYLANMAYCFWSQGKLDEAEKTLESVIVDRNDTTSHRTGLALNCLGNIQISRAQILLADHKHEEAEAMFDEAYTTHRQSLSIFTRTKGDFHHRTADSFHKLAFHLHRLHQYAEAEVFLRKALANYEKGGVMYRNEIARSTYRLGCVLQDSGKIAEGRKEVMAAEKLRQDILGKEWTPTQSEKDFEDLVFFWSR